jgi:hypothetical protein
VSFGGLNAGKTGLESDAVDVHSLVAKISERALRIAAATGVVLLALVAARPGWIRLAEAAAAGSAENYHFQYDYAGEALIWIGIAMIAVALGMTGFRKEDRKLSGAGAVLAVVTLMAQPLLFDREAPRRDNRMAAEVEGLRNGIESWRSRNDGRLPFLKQETAAAVNINGKPTAISGRGRQYAFRFITAGQRDDTFQSPPVGAEPGDIYYTISADEKSYALSVVAIDGNVSERLIIDPVLSYQSAPTPGSSASR